MAAPMRTVTLLGPQRLGPNLCAEVDRQGIDGAVAAITAGWQGREEEDDELRAHLGRPVVNLMLHARSEEVFAEDPALFAKHRARQDELRALQELYRFRLDFVLEPARRLLRRRRGMARLLVAERKAAIGAVRVLDRQHLQRVRAVHRAFVRRVDPLARPAVARQREAVAAILDDAAAVAIAGGHVAVLLNRLRLFGIDQLIQGKPLFLWSAGAMACAERVVLFHDSPPQGAGNAELLEAGLGLLPNLVPLPHAGRRLRLADPARVALFARRFAPAICVPLDPGACLTSADGGVTWQAAPAATRLDQGGALVPFPAAAGAAS